MMARALDLALLGKPFAGSNPAVGAVVVNRGRIVGIGFYRGPGTLHAEAEALAMAGEHARGATMFVTLEPHCYHGTQPPCTDKIIEAGIRRVVVAAVDPNPRVNGKGLAQLRDAGVDVELGLLEKDARQVNPGYFKCREKGLPYVILKLALSEDGFISPGENKRIRLSGPLALDYVHRLRGEVCGVAVGVGTVLSDDPLLTPRRVYAPRKPTRIVLDPSLRTPPGARILNQDAPTVLITTDRASPEKAEEIRAQGHEVWSVGQDMDMETVLRKLAEKNLDSVLFEGGARVAASLVENRYLLDELVLIFSPRKLGEGLSPFPEGFDPMENPEFRLVEVKELGEDTMFRFLVNREGEHHDP